jgi:hypothetical protein
MVLTKQDREKRKFSKELVRAGLRDLREVKKLADKQIRNGNKALTRLKNAKPISNAAHAAAARELKRNLKDTDSALRLLR